MFTSFHLIDPMPVTGVGNVKAQAQDRGMVRLKSMINGETCVLMLEDVLYIPTNKHNLIFLGRWDKAGGRYMGGDGKINLVTKNGKHVATGNKINNNLYKMQITTYHCNNKSPETTFLTEEPAQSWDVWYRCLRHVGFSICLIRT